MTRYNVETSLSPQEVFNRALTFFGEGSLWLNIADREPDALRFEGAGGHVVVKATTTQNKTKVRLEAREWDDEARFFREYIR